MGGCICANAPAGATLVVGIRGVVLGWTVPLMNARQVHEQIVKSTGTSARTSSIGPPWIPSRTTAQIEERVARAYSRGVHAAREAIAAVKYDTERSHAEWSVNAVHVPEDSEP